MNNRRNQQGQTALEYAMVVAVVIIALVAMQGLVKKALGGRHLDSTKKISEDFFSPEDSVIDVENTYRTQRTDTVMADGTSLSTIGDAERSTRKETVVTKNASIDAAGMTAIDSVLGIELTAPTSATDGSGGGGTP